MSKKTIVFDFDGVIHKNYNGYKDGTIYGEIDLQIINLIKEILKTHYVVISSNRSAEQIVNHLNKLNLGVKFEVFKKDMEVNMYWNKGDVVGVTNEKAIGIMYIDDRGYRYTSNGDLINFLRKHKIIARYIK